VLAEAFAGSMGGAAAVMAYAVRGPSSSLLAPSVSRGTDTRRAIALTFDDGPSESTEAILEVLENQSIKATFFQCGLNVVRLPEVARAAASQGHQIGNHTHSHRPLYFKSRPTIEAEFRDAQEAISSIVGTTPEIMRPPFGIRWFGFRAVQRELGLLGVMWTVIGLDWKLDSAGIAARLLRGASNGAIFCLHDGRELQVRPDLSQTLRALRETIPALQDRGFHFETVSQILCPTN
jgi:peptidoglycan/xylan/chitin deacetylase (PgdA/CDA1 family)